MTKDEMKNRISMALKDPILQQGFEIICKENTELEKENAELKADNDARKFAMSMSEKVEKQLREQIEKMKNCGNCKYGYCGGSSISIDKDGNRTFHNWNEEKQAYCDIGKNGKYQCWEIKEND